MKIIIGCNDTEKQKQILRPTYLVRKKEVNFLKFKVYSGETIVKGINFFRNLTCMIRKSFIVGKKKLI